MLTVTHPEQIEEYMMNNKTRSDLVNDAKKEIKMSKSTRIEVQATTDGGFVSHVIGAGVPDSVGYRMDTIAESVARLLAVYTRLADGVEVMLVSPAPNGIQKAMIGTVAGAVFTKA